MKYEIIGGSFPAVEVTFDKGEQVFTQSGVMAWKDEGIDMSTNAEGGFLKSLGRAFSGTSLMFVTHTASQDGQKATFAATLPGTIKEFHVDANHEYLAQKSAFLVAEKGVDVEATVNKNFFAGLFGGEGFILQRFSGNGTLFAEIDGYCHEIDLAPGQTIVVDTGCVALFEATCTYDIQSIKGFKNIVFGGEGLFLTTLTGPGKVYLQTLTAQDIANRLKPYLPQPTTTSSSSSHND